MMLFRFLNSFFFLFLLFLSFLVIVTAGKAAAVDSDRPTSSITSTNHDWFRTDEPTDSIEIEWEVSDPNGDEIKRIYQVADTAGVEFDKFKSRIIQKLFKDKS